MSIGLLLLLVSSLWAGSGVSFPSGGLRATTYADLKDHPQKSKTYNEFWTYHFRLSQGMQVILNYSRADLGSIKSPVCGADLSIIGFKGKTYTVAREYPREKFGFTDAKQQLNVHKDIWFRGQLPSSHQVYFKTKKNDVSYLVDLQLSRIAAGKTWGDGVFKVDKEKVGIYIHIPRAQVSGLVAINNDTLKVSGIAYMDHTFQTTMGPKIVRSGYRYQAKSDAINVGYLLIPLKHQNQVLGFGLSGSAGSLSLLKPQKVEVVKHGKTRGVAVANELKIRYDKETVTLHRTSDRQTLSVLNEFKGMTRWAVKKFMGGEVIYFRGTGALNGNLKADYNFFGLK